MAIKIMQEGQGGWLEYNNFVGSRADSLLRSEVSLEEESVALTLLPQLCELVASGKIHLSETIGELLDADDINASMSVEEMMKKRVQNSIWYIQSLLTKYRKNITIDDAAELMFERAGMTSTKLSGKSVVIGGVATPNVITSDIDLGKFSFILSNGGKYAGQQVISPEALKIYLNNYAIIKFD